MYCVCSCMYLSCCHTLQNKGTREEMRKYITELQVYNKRENILEALEEIRRLVS